MRDAWVTHNMPQNSGSGWVGKRYKDKKGHAYRGITVGWIREAIHQPGVDLPVGWIREAIHQPAAAGRAAPVMFRAGTRLGGLRRSSAVGFIG